MDTSLPKNKIEEIVNAVEKDLLHKTKIPFIISPSWKLQFPTEPGVYAVFEDSKLIYIGETAELRARMGDIRRTYNHTLRSKLGVLRLNAIKNGRRFSDEIETALDHYMISHISITFHALSFGRTEVESELIGKYKDQLLNSVSLRGKFVSGDSKKKVI